MKDPKTRLANYPNLLKIWDAAFSAAEELKLSGEDLDMFLSKNCRLWFFENHLKVEREGSDQEKRDINASAIVPFELSNIQLEVLDALEGRMLEGKKFRQRVMKARRARVSTIYLAIGYHIVRFNQNKKGLVFADRLETSRKLRRILDIFYQSDDLPAKPEIGKKTQGEGVYFHPPGVDKDSTEKDSFILLGSGEQTNSGIGGSLDFLHWSEAALTADASTHWTTISPSLQGALFDIAESTPSLHGQDEIIFPEFEKPTESCDQMFFSWLDVEEYRIDDKEKAKDFKPFVEHHLYGNEAQLMETYKISITQMLWRRFKLDELKSLNAFRQVYPISQDEAFFCASSLFFHRDLIRMTVPKNKIEPTSCMFADQGMGGVAITNDQNGFWKVYERVSHGTKYVCTVDTAEGKCADKEMRDPDYSWATIWAIGRPCREVATIRERIPPEILAEQVCVAARYYRDAFMVPERNSAGLAFIVRAQQMYFNIYREQKYRDGSFQMTQEYGFTSTGPSKFYALSQSLSMVRDANRGVIIHTELLRDEMSKYAQTGVKFAAIRGHDDGVTNLWLLAACLDQNPHLYDPPEEMSGQTQIGAAQYVPTISRGNEWQHKYVGY